MDETLRRRLVGLLTLAIGAFLLSWLLPRPGLERLQGERERVVTIDLTQPDAAPQERVIVADEGAVPAPQETAAAPAAPAPAAPQAAPAAGPLAGSPPQPEPEPGPEPAKPDPAREPPKPEPKTKPEPPKAPPPKPAPAVPKAAPAAPAAPRPGAPAGAKVAVQAGAYSHLDKAEGVRARAASSGVSCAIAPAETAKGKLYRLRCGPYADRAAAERAVAKLGAAGIAAQVVGAGG